MCEFPIKLKLWDFDEKKVYHKLVESDEDNSIKKTIVEEKEITMLLNHIPTKPLM